MGRVCKYCGVDISHTKLDRITCYSKECRRKHEKFLRENRKSQNLCVICSCDISHKHRKAKLCDNKECASEYNKDFYKKRLYNKTCPQCGCEYLGTGKRVLCDKCSEISKYTNFLLLVKQDIKCSKCGCIMDTVEKYTYKSELTRGLCEKCLEDKIETERLFRCEQKRLKKEKYDSCVGERIAKRELTIKMISDRMKTNNPMFKDGQTSKKIVIKRPIKDILLEFSERMKKNNPMFNPETKLRANNTFKERLKSGEIVFPKGSDHRNWRGNRTFNKHCRILLRKYASDEIAKSDYTCCICGIRGVTLHVHHEEPLRDIISKILEKNNTDGVSIFNDNDLLQLVSREILEYHMVNKPTIVVCKNCHAIIDSHYHHKIKDK